jgi:hypothetical protein
MLAAALLPQIVMLNWSFFLRWLIVRQTHIMQLSHIDLIGQDVLVNVWVLENAVLIKLIADLCSQIVRFPSILSQGDFLAASSQYNLA